MSRIKDVSGFFSKSQSRQTSDFGESEDTMGELNHTQTHNNNQHRSKSGWQL